MEAASYEGALELAEQAQQQREEALAASVNHQERQARKLRALLLVKTIVELDLEGLVFTTGMIGLTLSGKEELRKLTEPRETD